MKLFDPLESCTFVMLLVLLCCISRIVNYEIVGFIKKLYVSCTASFCINLCLCISVEHCLLTIYKIDLAFMFTSYRMLLDLIGLLQHTLDYLG